MLLVIERFLRNSDSGGVVDLAGAGVVVVAAGAVDAGVVGVVAAGAEEPFTAGTVTVAAFGDTTERVETPVGTLAGDAGEPDDAGTDESEDLLDDPPRAACEPRSDGDCESA